MFKTMRRLRYRPTFGSVVSHAVLGAAAGAAATWVMTRVTTVLYENENEEARRREDETRGNKTAYHVAADKVAHALVKRDLSDEERERYGLAIHWGLGAAAGAVYGALYAVYPEATWKRGLLYGAGFFLLVDEGANRALGLTPDPRRFPWQAHARGLAGHLVYGLTADRVLRMIERPALMTVGLPRHVTP